MGTIESSGSTPHKQHVVSKVILKQFVDRNGNVTVFDFRSGTSSLRTPSQIGYVEDFVSADEAKAEATWSAIETHVPDLLDAINCRSSSVFGELRHIGTDLIALHLARSITRQQIHPEVRERALQQSTDMLLTDESFLAERFHARTGLYVQGREGLRIQAELELSLLRTSVDVPEFFTHRVLDNFTEMKTAFRRSSLEILSSASTPRQFLIADDPAVSIKKNYRGLGPLSGVSIGEASTIVLPISPEYCLALGPQDAFHDLSARDVEFLNRIQLSYAHNRVYFSSAEAQQKHCERALELRGRGTRDPIAILLDR